jgi:hypothetical protein
MAGCLALRLTLLGASCNRNGVRGWTPSVCVPAVRYAPPVNREVTAQDFITAVQRLYDKAIPRRADEV